MNSPFTYIILLALYRLSACQEYEYTASLRPAPQRINAEYTGPANAVKATPVPILKQINRHNEDGSYTYGYEGADGAFKIETKLSTGEVKGKYGYVDDSGKLRIVEYGATKDGFQPAGDGITVAPPTLVDETTNRDGSVNSEYTGEYYEVQTPQPRQPPARIRPAAYPRPVAVVPVRQHHQQVVTPANVLPFQLSYVPRSRAPPPVEEENLSYETEPISQGHISSDAASFPAPITYAQPVLRLSSNAAVRQPQPQPQPQLQPQPQYIAAAAPIAQQYRPVVPAQQRGGAGPGPGILDQLFKEYALPPGGAAPLHDITFGVY